MMSSKASGGVASVSFFCITCVIMSDAGDTDLLLDLGLDSGLSVETVPLVCCSGRDCDLAPRVLVRP